MEEDQESSRSAQESARDSRQGPASSKQMSSSPVSSSRPVTARSAYHCETYVAKDGTPIPRRWEDRYTRRPRTSLSFQSATDDQLSDILDRVTRPTISWTGGESLRSKEFVYISPMVTKMNPYPRLKRMNRYENLNERKLPTIEVESIVSRLYTRHTRAWSARVSPNPHSRSPMTTF